MTSTTYIQPQNVMGSLVAWAGQTFDSPQAAVASAAMHAVEAGTYQMGWDTANAEAQALAPKGMGHMAYSLAIAQMNAHLQDAYPEDGLMAGRRLMAQGSEGAWGMIR